jgi:hypothetical protein
LPGNYPSKSQSIALNWVQSRYRRPESTNASEVLSFRGQKNAYVLIEIRPSDVFTRCRFTRSDEYPSCIALYCQAAVVLQHPATSPRVTTYVSELVRTAVTNPQATEAPSRQSRNSEAPLKLPGVEQMTAGIVSRLVIHCTRLSYNIHDTESSPLERLHLLSYYKQRHT